MNPFRWLLELRRKLHAGKEIQRKAFEEIHEGIENGKLSPDMMQVCLDEITVNVKNQDTKPIVGGKP